MTFRNKLSALVGVKFRVPTTSEWQYAYKGGKKTLGYTYSGSNDADEVAWYANNTSEKQNVKTKKPNELGLYDMSGNVYEWTLSDNSDYYNYPYGGAYTSSIDNLKVSSYTSSYTSGSEYVGFRLALTLK